MDNKILRKKTFFVLIVTLITMAAEIYFGIKSNSMGLTADGLHMGTHAIAFSITLIICVIAIKYEDKTEKLNALGGLISSILLGITALGIILESIECFFNPNIIHFDEAILVAIIGLVVNLICALIMGGSHAHLHGHDHCGENKVEKENLNYKAAYLHIISDCLTSILAIVALLCGKYMNLIFLDSLIGILGGVIISRWAITLYRTAINEYLK